MPILVDVLTIATIVGIGGAVIGEVVIYFMKRRKVKK